MAAAAVAWPVQVGAFALLLRYRSRIRRFLAVWAGGTLVRMGVIGAAAFVLTRVSGLAPAPTLLGLAGFFFGLLLLEPVFFEPGGNRRESVPADGPAARRPAGRPNDGAAGNATGKSSRRRRYAAGDRTRDDGT